MQSLSPHTIIFPLCWFSSRSCIQLAWSRGNEKPSSSRRLDWGDGQKISNHHTPDSATGPFCAWCCGSMVIAWMVSLIQTKIFPLPTLWPKEASFLCKNGSRVYHLLIFIIHSFLPPHNIIFLFCWFNSRSCIQLTWSRGNEKPSSSWRLEWNLTRLYFWRNVVFSGTFQSYPAELDLPMPPENRKGTKRNAKRMCLYQRYSWSTYVFPT